MKIALFISIFLIALLGFAFIYQGLRVSDFRSKHLDRIEEIKSYELVIDGLLKTEDKQFETLKKQLHKDFEISDTPIQYSNDNFGIVIRWKERRIWKMSQYGGLELIFSKNNKLLTVKTNNVKE
jgi:hypothetical protein